jgi:DNA-binding GntR family transcriptional regulator
VLAKHTDIFKAIAASDPVAAKREMEFHIQELIDHNLQILSRAESGYLARDLTPEELAYGA